MKKIFCSLILPIFFLLSSCEKNEEVAPTTSQEITETEYNAFLKQTTPQFMGSINGKAFSWHYGEFSLNTGRCEYEPLRELYFGLAHSGKFFRLYFPHYNFRDEVDFSRVFAPGKKQTGDIANDFHLIMTINDQIYETSRSLKTNELEVIKTEEYILEGDKGQNGVSIPYSEKHMRVWIKVNAQLSTCSDCPNEEPVVVKGLMIGEVYDYKGEI